MSDQATPKPWITSKFMHLVLVHIVALVGDWLGAWDLSKLDPEVLVTAEGILILILRRFTSRPITPILAPIAKAVAGKLLVALLCMSLLLAPGCGYLKATFVTESGANTTVERWGLLQASDNVTGAEIVAGDGSYVKADSVATSADTEQIKAIFQAGFELGKTLAAPSGVVLQPAAAE